MRWGGWVLRASLVGGIVATVIQTSRLSTEAKWDQEAQSVTHDKYGVKPLRKTARGSYDLIYLGAFGGQMQPYHGASMNAQGDVCGALLPEPKSAPTPFRLVRGKAAELLQIDGQSVSGRANAINNRGDVAGVVSRQSEVGFLWSDSGVSLLNPVQGFRSAVATAIADSGIVAGYSMTLSDLEYWRWKAVACTWRNGKPSALPLPPGCVASRAYGINSNGMVVGDAITQNARTRAFVFDGTTSRLLPLLPGGSVSSAASVNAKGQIAGSSDHSPGASPELPFDVHAVIWEHDKAHDVGLPKGYRYAKAVAINDHGQAVITAQLLHWDLKDIDFYKAFVWDSKRGLRRLNTLLDPDLGHHISKAYAMNNAGEILAQGRFSHRPWEQLQPFYLLVPHS